MVTSGSPDRGLHAAWCSAHAASVSGHTMARANINLPGVTMTFTAGATSATTDNNQAGAAPQDWRIAIKGYELTGAITAYRRWQIRSRNFLADGQDSVVFQRAPQTFIDAPAAAPVIEVAEAACGSVVPWAAT